MCDWTVRVGGHDVEHVVSCYRVQLFCVFTRGFTPSPTSLHLLPCLDRTLPHTSHSQHCMQYGSAPLHDAKSAEVAKVLVNAKADVNIKNSVSVHEHVLYVNVIHALCDCVM